VTRSYLVHLTAGAHSWTVTDEDPPGYGLADPLTIGWTLPDTEHRPTQPDPMVATFAVVEPSASVLDDLVLGDLVTIAVTFGPAAKPEPDVVFYGRIAQGEAAPDRRGMLYRFTCADLTADLNAYTLGSSATGPPVPGAPLDYPVQSVAARMTNMLTRAGLADTAVVRDPIVAAVDPQLTVDAIAQPGAANLLTEVIGLWDGVGLAGLADLAPVNYRAIVAPHPGAGSGTSSGIPYRWALDAVPDAYVPSAVAPLPATFGHYFPDPQGYGLYIDPDDRDAGVIDACVVEFDSQWAALQGAVVNRAAVVWLAASNVDPAVDGADRFTLVTYTEENPAAAGQPTVTSTRETQVFCLTQAPVAHPSYVAGLANANRLGAMMVPPPQNPGGWAPDAFHWLLWKDPAGLANFPAIFPRHDATEKPTPAVLRTACYVRPIVIAGIPGMWNAADATRDWIGGQLTTVTLTIADGRPVVDFELAPTLPEPGNPATGTNSWNTATGTWNAQTGTWDDKPPGRVAFRWSDAALAGVTWNQLHPQRWNMYRLARGT
jgi:hypothetical protein